MRRTKTKTRAPRITATVTPAPLTNAEKAKIAEPIMPDIMQAMDYASDVGHSAGLMEGKMTGFKAGLNIPRSVGERRAQQANGTGAIDQLLAEVKRELLKAMAGHGPMHSTHEAYGVIKEELDEYWDEVRANRALQASGRKELVQTAAMAVRALYDTNPR